MSQLELTTLGKSCEFFNGKAHEKSIDENGQFIVVNSKFISQEGRVIKCTKDQMFPLYKGDIVMVMSDVPNGKALAKCFIIDKDDTYSLNQRICCIRSKEFDTKYLYYQLNRNEHFLEFNNGENQTNLRKDDILACPLLKPSMEEQKRMVVELDLAFSNLGKAISNTERNYLNNKELFENYLQGVLEKKGECWEHARLGDICKINDGTHFSPKNSSEGDYMYVTAKNIKPYYIDLSNISYISEKDHRQIYSRCSPKKGDVLYIKDGATAGIATINTIEEEFSLLSSVALLKCSDKILNTFLVYYMNSNMGKKNFLDYIDGAAITRLTLVKIKNVCFQLPPVSEQKAIVQQLDVLKIDTQKLEALYQNKLDCLEELKSKVLKRAFENELIEAE